MRTHSHSSIVAATLFCTKCQHFWSEAISQAKIPHRVTRCEDIYWLNHEVVLHASLHELKLASDSRCILCCIIFNTPTKFEHERLFRDRDEPLKIVLDIDPSKGPYPVLSVALLEASGDGIRIPQRILTACGGLLENCE